MREPATGRTSRSQAGFTRNERGSSAGSTSSSEVMPTIFTNPPAGMALTPYSVSPLVRDHSVGPKPRKNWVAFMPNFLAVAKWPNSCSMTETDSATMKMIQPTSTLIRRRLPPAARYPVSPLSGEFSRPRSCPAIGVEHVFQANFPVAGAVMLRDYPHHGVHDPGEGQHAGQEGGHALLVGRVVDRRAGPPGPPRLPGQRDRGNVVLVERLERPGVRGGPVHRRSGAGDTVRPGQRQRDRYPHVRGA